MEDRHTIRVADIECISLTVIVWLKPRWAQSARFAEIILATLSLAKVSPSRQSTNRFARAHGSVDLWRLLNDDLPLHRSRRERSRQSLLNGGEQPAGDARPRPAVDDRLPGGLPQHVVLGWRKCEHLIQLAGEIGRIAGLERC